MKIRIALVGIGLALLLSACLPDIPPSAGTASVTITPPEAAGATFQWQIRGMALSGREHTYSGECAAGCSSFTQDMLVGSNWELRVSPPQLNPATSEMGWVATGEAGAEPTADHTQVFELHRDETLELTAGFRRVHILAGVYEAPRNAPGTVELQNLYAGSPAGDFTVSELTASCVTGASLEPLTFGLPEGTTLTVTDTPQSVELTYLDDPAETPLFGETTVCTLDGFDGDNRPVGFRLVPQPASN